MLARPVSSSIASVSSWHVVYIMLGHRDGGAGHRAVRGVCRARTPKAKVGYAALLASMGHLFMTTPVLRRRAFYQAFLFGAFSLFWTTISLLLAGPAFHMSQRGIALVRAGRRRRRYSCSHCRPRRGSRLEPCRHRGGDADRCIGLHPHRDRPPRLDHVAGLLVAAAILLDFGVQGMSCSAIARCSCSAPKPAAASTGFIWRTSFLAGAAGSAVGVWSSRARRMGADVLDRICVAGGGADLFRDGAAGGLKTAATATRRPAPPRSRLKPPLISRYARA